jgi:hypothetical protein
VSSARPTSPASAPISAVALTPAAAGLRFSTSQFAISGLAYDALSARFVLGDRLGRRLVLVDERSNQTMDLVRADSAGFLDIAAVEIDAKRGDLWVASTDEGAGTLHRLQLVSGRPIRAFGVAPDLEPVKLADLSIASTGTVVVLDSRTPRLFVLRPRATSLEPVVRIDVQDATSVAAGGDDRTAFVAHRDGISRIDLQTRAISPVAVPNGLSLRRLERIRWQGSALVAIQLDDDGSRRVFRLEMNPRGTAITKAVGLNVPAPIGDQAFVTISGNDLLYLTSDPAEADGPQASASRSRAFVAYRVPLQ